MSPRRGATDLAGVLLIDKPAGPTSHDVVATVRRLTGERRIGHAGTLDPLATGLLVVLVGPYTRLERYLSASDKEYEAGIAFGAETDTDDAEGTVVRTADVPEDLLDRSTAVRLLAGVQGTHEQRPPAYSAIKVGGRVAHRDARAGVAVELDPRPVTIHEAELIGIDVAHARWDVRFRVSKGTYVRALARDLGRAAGSAAHLVALRRTAAGPALVADAFTLDDLASRAQEHGVEPLFADPLPLLGLPVVTASPTEVADGRPLPRDRFPGADGAAVAIAHGGALLAIYRAAPERLAAEVVLPRGAAA